MAVFTLEAKNMRRATCLAGLAALLLASGAMAREAADDETVGDTAASERPHVRVLASPYDLAGFYSSGGSSRSYGFFDRATDRYPISRYYRSSDQESIGYWRSQAWRRPSLSAARLRRARRMGSHRDLYLFVPAVLVPVVPLDERESEAR